jgi:hypothetical protein
MQDPYKDAEKTPMLRKFTVNTAVLTLCCCLGSAASALGAAILDGVTLNDSSAPVSVAPNATIAASVSVTNGNGSNNHWGSTRYTVKGQSPICVDVPFPDFTTDGGSTSQIVSFNAPAAFGTYSVNFQVFSGDVCGADGSNTITLTNSIIVCANDDNDSACNDVDDCPNDPNKTTSGTCGCGIADDDTDGDGIADCIDPCVNDADNDADGDKVCGDVDLCSGTPVGEKVNTDGCSCSQMNCDDGDPCTTDSCLDGVCSHAFEDADGDSICDANDLCPGFDDTEDTDNDGTPDGCDACPDDADKVAPGICGCGAADTDTDADGTADCNDGCQNDPAKTDSGACGCGIADTDSDGDGTPDCNDACPNDPDNDADGDKVCGDVDLCSGTPSGEIVNTDGCSCSQLSCDDGDTCTTDSCLDGVCSNVFEDADGDGSCDAKDLCPGFDDSQDADGDGIPDGCDDCANDADNDADSDKVCGDVDLCSGTPSGETVNTDGCSCSQLNCDDGDPCTTDSCLDGVCSNVFEDADGDSICDAKDQCPGFDDSDDADGDGIPDGCDDCANDSDNDADGDKVCGDMDLCSGTPSGETVSVDGCSCSQLDCDDGDPCTTDSCLDGVCSNVFEDADGDGVCDADDECPGFDDSDDADGDGAAVGCDACPDDPAKTAPGICGCGVPDTDTDADGTPDCSDGCPDDGDKTDPGACGCGVADTDSDGDGTPDCNDDSTTEDNDPATLPTSNLCGTFTCGTGAAGMMPLLLLCLSGMRRPNRSRRKRA